MTGAYHLADYACKPENSRGRHHAESESPTRTCFQRDRDRIIHCAAFRRLQYKTQVFVNHEGDFFRTRLTHSLEVSQIARSVSRHLHLNEDLTEALALAHDLGHPPFGHAGEDALTEMMEPWGGFDHNAQSLKVITRLEQRYAAFDGLNLTWETLEGVVKHNGPLRGPLAESGNGRPLSQPIIDYDADHDLGLDTFAGAEAQVAAICDDIAYDNHDIDDGLRAGLFSVEDLDGVPLIGPAFATARGTYPDLDRPRLIIEAVRHLIGDMVGDLITETERRLGDLGASTPDDVRAGKAPVAAFSDGMRAQERGLKEFLYENMYRHYKLNRMTSKARRVVRELFHLFITEPDCLPTDWRNQAGPSESEATVQLVGDYIAGMTDRYALDEHRRLFDLQARVS